MRTVPRLHETVARRVKDDLASGTFSVLPAMSELAKRYAVSERTLWSAIRELARAGVVQTSSGKATMPTREFCRKHGLAEPVADTTVERLYQRMRGRVKEGLYRGGDAFPKAEYFTRTERASRGTLAQVMRRLALEGLAHKRGRRWFVGPPAAKMLEPLRHAHGESRVVVIMTPTEGDLFNFFATQHTLGFQWMLRGELAKHSLRLTATHQHRSGNEPAGAIVGIDAIESYIRSLGRRYAGTLAFDIGDPPHTEECLRRLCSFGRPVVFHDISNQQSDWRRSRFDSTSFFRLYLDESAAISTAISGLARAGHTTIGFLTANHPYYTWARTRLALLRAAAESLSPRLRVLDATLSEPFWQIGYWATSQFRATFFDHVAQVLDLSRRGGKDLRSGAPIGAVLLKKTPSIGSLLAQGATALVACNDYAAMETLYWLNAVGLEIPRHLSMVSFDNIGVLEPYGISSVDFGFSQLGYCAAHLFIGDIPISVDSEGQLAGTCMLIDRGSIAPPGDIAGLVAKMK